MKIGDMEIPPLKLAKWLSIALAQRDRAKTKSRVDFGEESPTYLELSNECMAINDAMNACVRAQAAAQQLK